MSTRVEPGTHKVKVIDWGLRETEKGGIQAFISFSNGLKFWQMVNVNDTGDEILAKALTVCGFRGSDLPDLFDDDALDKNKEVEIFVKYKPNEKTGKEEAVVYVNDGRQMKGALTGKDAKGKLKELRITIKPILKTVQKEIGVRDRSVPDTKLNENESNLEDNEDIPF